MLDPQPVSTADSESQITGCRLTEVPSGLPDQAAWRCSDASSAGGWRKRPRCLRRARPQHRMSPFRPAPGVGQTISSGNSDTTAEPERDCLRSRAVHRAGAVHSRPFSPKTDVTTWCERRGQRRLQPGSATFGRTPARSCGRSTLVAGFAVTAGNRGRGLGPTSGARRDTSAQPRALAATTDRGRSVAHCSDVAAQCRRS
jgi:hypothetical protein